MDHLPAARRPAVVTASPVAHRRALALGQDRGAAGAVDRAVHLAPAEQRLIRGADDRVDRFLVMSPSTTTKRVRPTIRSVMRPRTPPWGGYHRPDGSATLERASI
jgi:hypothetical protein